MTNQESTQAKIGLGAKPDIDFLFYYPSIDEIQDVKLRKAVLDILQELWRSSSFTDINAIPTSGKIDYPNMPHTQCVVEISLAVADAFERHHGVKTNRDHLIASSVLQDASKMVEYEPKPEGGVEHTQIGKSYPHAFWCAHLAAKYDLPPEIINTILTHSPQAAQFPKTLEGKILYYADQLDVIAIHGDRWKKNLFVSK